ncbi:MAG: hypothetical protein P8186_04520 [Anaerolineae bacterium]
MMLQAIFQRKPEIFERLADHWRQITGGQLLAIDEAGEWLAGSRRFAHPGNGVQKPANSQSLLRDGQSR